MKALEIEVVPQLPVETLSFSALTSYLRCPEKFRLEYIERVPQARYSYRVVGIAVDRTIRTNYEHKIKKGVDLPAADMDDVFSDCWKQAVTGYDDDPPVKWEDEPAAERERAHRLTKVYHRDLAPLVMPQAVNQRLEMRYEGAQWRFVGKLDIVSQTNIVIDAKTAKKTMDKTQLHQTMQPAAYYALRRANELATEGFQFHLVRALTKSVDAQVLDANRTWNAVDAFELRLLAIAREIAWRAENDEWQGAAPGSWWCSQGQCGHWATCPMGKGAV